MSAGLFQTPAPFIIIIIADYLWLGFAPALRFLRSQILCRLYKSPSDETINRGPPCVYACKKITNTCVGNNKTTQRALKCVSLHNVEVGHYTKEEEEPCSRIGHSLSLTCHPDLFGLVEWEEREQQVSMRRRRWVSMFRPFSFYKMNATVTMQTTSLGPIHPVHLPVPLPSPARCAN